MTNANFQASAALAGEKASVLDLLKRLGHNRAKVHYAISDGTVIVGKTTITTTKGRRFEPLNTDPLQAFAEAAVPAIHAFVGDLGAAGVLILSPFTDSVTFETNSIDSHGRLISGTF